MLMARANTKLVIACVYVRGIGNSSTQLAGLMFYSLQRDEFGHEQRGKLEGDAAMSGMRSDRDHVMPRQCYVLQIQICLINHEISKFFFLPLARIMSSNQILHLPQTARQTREGETISLLPRNDNKGEGRV